MPRIICRACGREVYATAPIEQLFADERRCPRCGTPLQNDRRDTDRRVRHRRENPPADPGPPAGEDERRVDERRKGRRRQGDGGPRRVGGWIE
jgi:DNA-directed RNA polymerase subunit RPC12/RpoP